MGYGSRGGGGRVRGTHNNLQLIIPLESREGGELHMIPNFAFKQTFN